MFAQKLSQTFVRRSLGILVVTFIVAFFFLYKDKLNYYVSERYSTNTSSEAQQNLQQNQNVISQPILNPTAKEMIKSVFYEPENVTDSLNLVVFVLTTPNNREKRNIIRSTWANCEKLKTLTFESRYIPKDVHCRRIFVIGKPVNGLDNILKEAKEFQDMLIFDYTESYRTIYFKIMSMFYWVIKYSPRWILKADDDVYVHLPRLVLELSTLKPSRFYGGRVAKRENVVRDRSSPAYVTREAYSPSTYPPFCSGTMYIVTADLLSDMFLAIESFPIPFVDDVYVGVLMKHIGVIPHHFSGFWLRPDGERFVDDAMLKTKIAISHQLLSIDLEQLHDRTIRLGTDTLFVEEASNKYSSIYMHF